MDGLESARLKLVRAAEHLEAIREHAAAYGRGEPHEIVVQTDGKEKVKVREHPPAIISVLAGEMLYQIRSALDHLAFDLVKLNCGNITLPTNWFERCEFPLWTKPPQNGTLPRPQNDFERILPGIPFRMYTFIEGSQPYNRNPIGNRLWLLAVLSNIDKHRYLNLTKARLSKKEMIATENGYSHASVHRIDDGTELDPMPTDLYFGSKPVSVERSISTGVSFAEPMLGGATTMPIEDALEVCLEGPQTIILPAFEEFFDSLP